MSSTPPLGPTEKAVVDVMVKAPDMSFSRSKLAEISGCMPAHVGRILPNLKERGLVVRHSQDGESYWRLTDSARNAIKNGKWNLELMAKDAGKGDEPDEPDEDLEVDIAKCGKVPTTLRSNVVVQGSVPSGNVTMTGGPVTMSEPFRGPKEARTAANLLYRIEMLVSEFGGAYTSDGLMLVQKKDPVRGAVSRITLDIILEAPIV